MSFNEFYTNKSTNFIGKFRWNDQINLETAELLNERPSIFSHLVISAAIKTTIKPEFGPCGPLILMTSGQSINFTCLRQELQLADAERTLRFNDDGELVAFLEHGTM